METCGGCGQRFARGFFRCPRCAAPSATYAPREGAMPRITVAEGPSNPDAVPGEVGYTGPDVDEAPAVEVRGEHGPELVDLPPGQTVAAPDYTSMTQAALRDEAKTRGLPVGGSKADLATRLTDHDAAQPSAAVAAVAGLVADGQQGADA